MTTDEKLAAILAAVQTDPGNRGLARDPHDNLFTATAGDFRAACRSLAVDPQPIILVVTGFIIPSGQPPRFETDGPLGAVFLARALTHLGATVRVASERNCGTAIGPGLRASGILRVDDNWPLNIDYCACTSNTEPMSGVFRHAIAVERIGPASDNNLYTMRGTDITQLHSLQPYWFTSSRNSRSPFTTIGIGDGGNEIGMGKIPHETIVKNIPNGDLIHCRVPTDHLIVAGVSNWGAYALAAGIYVLRSVKPPAGLFDPDREREILEIMVRKGPLVDGVTGQQTATVDGLSWDEYAAPLVRIREILES